MVEMCCVIMIFVMWGSFCYSVWCSWVLVVRLSVENELLKMRICGWCMIVWVIVRCWCCLFEMFVLFWVMCEFSLFGIFLMKLCFCVILRVC